MSSETMNVAIGLNVDTKGEELIDQLNRRVRQLQASLRAINADMAKTAKAASFPGSNPTPKGNANQSKANSDAKRSAPDFYSVKSRVEAQRQREGTAKRRAPASCPARHSNFRTNLRRIEDAAHLNSMLERAANSELHGGACSQRCSSPALESSPPTGRGDLHGSWMRRPGLRSRCPWHLSCCRHDNVAEAHRAGSKLRCRRRQSVRGEAGEASRRRC
ncbi:hypothetical protein CLBKND_04207 [Methylorubrum aminovorans]